MLSKKQVKQNLKRTIEIEKMLIEVLADRNLSDEEAAIVSRELVTAADFIVRFKECLKEMSITNVDKYKKGDK